MAKSHNTSFPIVKVLDMCAFASDVFELPKATGALTQGAQAYWHSTSKNVTGTATGNTLIGVVTQAAGENDTTAVVRLNGSF